MVLFFCMINDCVEYRNKINKNKFWQIISLYNIYELMQQYMLSAEWFQIPKIKKLPTQYLWRDIYTQQSVRSNDKELFLKEITPTNTYPIVLIGDWKEDELDINFIEMLVFQHIDNPRSVVFITKEEEWIFDINVFGKLSDEEIPLTYIGPIHSTHLLTWIELPKTWKINLESQRIQYETRVTVAKNIID